MTIYRIADDEKIVRVPQTTFEDAKLKERQDLQQMLKDNIGVISGDSPDDEILVVAEEFSDWEDSKRRIDLLGIDKGANLVVIELKRTEDGGHMDLQAIRYAAMISTLTFDDLVLAYSEYLVKSESGKNAKDELVKFLGWDEPDDEPTEKRFGQEVKIILASADFSKELATSVMWLNSSGLDIRCVRIQPYENNGEILLDVQTIIPVPEAKDFLGNLDKKKQQERVSRSSAKDYTKYNVSVADVVRETGLSKRKAMFHLVSGVLESGGTPECIEEITRKRLFQTFDGELDTQQIQEKARLKEFPDYLYFMDKIFHSNGNTYLLTSHWTGSEPEVAADAIKNEFPNLEIKFERAD